MRKRLSPGAHARRALQRSVTRALEQHRQPGSRAPIGRLYPGRRALGGGALPRAGRGDGGERSARGCARAVRCCRRAPAPSLSAAALARSRARARAAPLPRRALARSLPPSLLPPRLALRLLSPPAAPLSGGGFLLPSPHRAVSPSRPPPSARPGVSPRPAPHGDGSAGPGTRVRGCGGRAESRGGGEAGTERRPGLLQPALPIPLPGLAPPLLRLRRCSATAAAAAGVVVVAAAGRGPVPRRAAGVPVVSLT